MPQNARSNVQNPTPAAPRHAAGRHAQDAYAYNQRLCRLLLKIAIGAAAVEFAVAVIAVLLHAPGLATMVGINGVMFACIAAFLVISMDRRARRYRAARADVRRP